mmetsp:Transcript_17762/g.30074  ORF Transcript_17762/g.30074 Transcript_17762/m.30074 type:complete len:150 (+) Transcript_17762:202-651(+)
MLDGLYGGERLDDEALKEYKLRWKKLGSALSTARMTTRLGDFLGSVRFFHRTISEVAAGKRKLGDESMLEFLMQFIDFWSGFFDNWVFLVRIKLIRYYTKWQENWVDWLSSACTFSFILLSIISKAIDIYRDSLQKWRAQARSNRCSDS